jgi:hypothetical protein
MSPAVDLEASLLTTFLMIHVQNYDLNLINTQTIAVKPLHATALLYLLHFW